MGTRIEKRLGRQGHTEDGKPFVGKTRVYTTDEIEKNNERWKRLERKKGNTDADSSITHPSH